MRVLVVGGGFLGAEIVSNLIESGFEVRKLSRNVSSNFPCEQIIADMQNPDSYSKVLSSWLPEIVIQTAWITNKETYRTSPLNSAYMRSTVKFAELSYLSGVQHFLILGSSAEYGNPTEPCNALTTPAKPIDVYGTKKLHTLQKLMKMSEKFSSRLSWARIFQPYGRNQDLARLIPYATRKLVAGQSFEVTNPNLILDWISSRDVASALTFAIKNSMDQVFDVGTSRPISVLEVLQTLAKILNVDSQLLNVDCNAPSSHRLFPVVVSKDSPLLRAKWRPKDDLISGLNWTLYR